MHRPLAVLMVAACGLASLLPAQAQRTPSGPLGAPPAALAPVEGEVIVAFRPGADTARKHRLAAGTAAADAGAVRSMLSSRASALGARVGRSLQAGAAVAPDVQVMRAPGVDAATLARQLAADADVLYAVPNGRKRRVAAPNDPLYTSGPAINAALQSGGPVSGQWYLRAPTATVPSAIDIEPAWLQSTGSGVVVAVLDTGVRADHPDLAGQQLPGYDMVSDTAIANDGSGRDSDPSDPGDWVTSAEAATGTFSGCDASDSSWHGTSTASLIVAATNNSTGMAGVAPGAKVVSVRVLGKCFGTDSDIIAGMRWAAGLPVTGVPTNPNPAKVINMSLGGGGACSSAYQQAINEITAAGVLIVAAAGNSAGGPVNEPANCTGVVGVLALRHAGSKVGFSDLGPEISIAAPGGNCINVSAGSACLYPILAASNSGTRGPASSIWTDSYNITVGTSFSSPLVAGVAALMKARQPSLTPAQIRTAMRASARPFPTSGADNGTDPTPVTACRAPVAGQDQLQCYCNTSYCGAGMLDAGRALAAAVGTLAQISVSPAAPVAGTAVSLSATSSQVANGATISSYAWSITSAGGIVSGFTSSTNASTAALTPSAAGSFTVQLQITDSLGNSNSTTATVVVAAAGGPPSSGGGGDSGGGGAASAAWVAGVALAAAVLRRLSRRQAGASGLRSEQQRRA
jgi:serine protease